MNPINPTAHDRRSAGCRADQPQAVRSLPEPDRLSREFLRSKRNELGAERRRPDRTPRARDRSRSASIYIRTEPAPIFEGPLRLAPLIMIPMLYERSRWAWSSCS
jgi:hypothetical protein